MEYFNLDYIKNEEIINSSKYNVVSFDKIIKQLQNWAEIRNYIEIWWKRYLRVSDLWEYWILDNNLRFVDSEVPENLKLSFDDILISRSWSLWLVSIVTDKIIDSILSSHIFKITLDIEKVNPIYLEIYLRSELWQKQFKRKNNWWIIPEINQPALKSIKIILPPLEIQNKIVEKMDLALKEKKEKEMQAKSLFESIDDFVLSELWIEYKEIEEKKVFGLSLSELGETKRLDSFYNSPKFLELEKMLKNGKYWVEKIMNLVEYYKKWIEVWSNEYVENWEIPFVRVSDIDNFWIHFPSCNKYISKEKFEELKQYKPENWEVLFSKDWTIWFTCLVSVEKDYVISWWILRLKVNNKVLPEFLQIILSRKIINKLLEQRSIWAIIRHLDLEAFESLNLPLPPLEIQEKIALGVKSRIEKAKVLESEAKEVYEKAKSEVEEMILD